MVRFLVHRPVAVLVSFFALLLLGIAAYLKLPVSLLPQVDVPLLWVQVQAQDLSAQEAENRLTRPLRNSLMQLRGLRHIESTTQEGAGEIRLQFEHDVDISMAFVEVNEKVDIAMNSLPRETVRPTVTKSSISDIPVFRLNLSPKSKEITTDRIAELSSFAREVIRRRIEQLPEVAMVDMTGYLQPQVEVLPKTGYLESLGLNADILLQAFRENQLSLGSILVKDGLYRYFLRFSGELQDLNSLGNTPLNIRGRLLRLSDVADIKYSTAESEGAYYSKGKPAINFAIIKQAGARIDDLQRSFNTLLSRMKREYRNIQFEVTQDQTQLLDYAISNLQQDLFLGGCLAFILMLFFIRKVRMAILIGVTMPLSLLVSQLGFYLFGISLNIISLGGLILGLSMIIDTSIVVMDTISRYRQEKYNVKDAAVAGTNEIIRPLVTSVLTNCAVFIPLIFLSGLAGAIFYEQALSIVIGVVSSLLVAVILLPPLFAWVHKRDDGQTNSKRLEIKTIVNVGALYDRALRYSFRHPVIVSLAVIAFVAGGGVLYFHLEKDRLPPITRHDFEVSIDWNEYLNQEEEQWRIQAVTRQLDQQAKTINVWSGPQQYLLPIMDKLGYSQIRMYILAENIAQLPLIQNQLTQYVHRQYPQARISFDPARNAFDEVFANSKAPLILRVSKKEQQKMPALNLVKELIDSLEQALPSATINPIASYDKVLLHLDHELIARHGLSTTAIATAINNALKNQKIADFQASETLIPLVLTQQRPESIHEMLQSTLLKGKSSQEIPLAALVQVSRQSDYKYITAGTGGEYYPITIYTDHAATDVGKVGDIAKAFGDDIESQLDGSYFENKQLVEEMALIFLVSVLLLYFILAAQFESLIQPLFILVELPIAVCGAFIALYLGGSSLNLMSMIGIIVMSGLIINDSILKIDAINQMRNQGVPLMESIFEGGHRRLNSIVMISLTSIGALSPTLFMDDLGSELQKPLALALIGGMTVGLFVSLFFVPLIYWFIYKRQESKNEKQKSCGD